MRAILGLLLIALTGGAATSALAADDAALTALNRAAFDKPKAAAEQPKKPRFQASYHVGEGPAAPAESSQAPLAADRLLSERAWALTGGSATWTSHSVSRLNDDGAVDTLRMTVVAAERGPGGVVLASPGGRLQPETNSVNLDFERSAPITSGRFALDVAPHFGVAMNDQGGSALAGAAVRLQLPQRRNSIAGQLGFQPDREADGTRGRWFLFAEGSGELVGVHLSRSGGLMPRANLTVDDGVNPTVVSDSQAGVGWKKGAMQASFGYVHREIRNDLGYDTSRQIGDIKGDMVAFSFSLKSR
ncbi:lipid A-modifier LpxR family protein [Phenylobacterium montanum]|uniref:DUF2219 family protein n=1 Tax=Phenylobacterium montanum TaxID=2823693 RepID=A0A975FWJ1_9CAUL|nr:lipid A-modifier LpxR family protein [Caulobacter sp. S6]QUD86605.1 DUF2219 family protein [Caulobacter sp. S6]